MVTPRKFAAILATTVAVALLVTGCGDDASGADTGPGDEIVFNAGFADVGPSNSSADLADAGQVANNDPVDAGSSDAASQPDMTEPHKPKRVDIDWPATVEEFVASASDVSYVSELSLPATDPSGYPSCCRDYGERSKRPGPDNALGSLMGQLINMAPESGAETLLQDSVESGRIVLLLDHRAFDGAADFDGYALSWIDGGWFDGTTWASASDGGGTFWVDRESFIPGSGEPRSVMNPATIDEGFVEAGPTTLRLQVPVGFALVPIEVHEAQIEGSLRKGPDGIAYSGGRLSGYAKTSDVFGALNEIVGANCECLGLNDPYAIYNESSNGNWSGTCTTMAQVACPEPEQEVCRVLGGASVIDGGFCGVLPQILQNASDIDSDSDGAWDSLSLGLKWSAVPATLR